MNINFGAVEWEENESIGPSSLGKKLAAALTVLTLAALAMGSWLEAPDLAVASTEVAAAAEILEGPPKTGPPAFVE